MKKPNIEEIKETLQEYSYPKDVIIEVTRYCNLKCIMCPHPNLKRRKGEMSFPVFKKIVDEIVAENQNTKIWLAIMGEPLLLGEKLISMIEYAKNNGIAEINLNTNGVLLNPQLSQKLIDAELDKILFSIDAISEEAYNKIRVGGDFNKVIHNIKYFINLKTNSQSSKPEVIVQFIEMEENAHETDKFKDFWLNEGAIVKIRPKLGWGTAIKSQILDDTALNCTRFPCAWLTRTVSIHWDGSFSQCDADHEGTFSPGNIQNQSIKEIWDGEIAIRRKRHWNNNYDFEPCKNCKDWLAGRSYFYYPTLKR